MLDTIANMLHQALLSQNPYGLQAPSYDTSTPPTNLPSTPLPVATTYPASGATALPVPGQGGTDAWGRPYGAGHKDTFNYQWYLSKVLGYDPAKTWALEAQRKATGMLPSSVPAAQGSWIRP